MQGQPQRQMSQGMPQQGMPQQGMPQQGMPNPNMQNQPNAQQAPVQQNAQQPGAPKLSDGPGVQVVIRMFQPDMSVLKNTARQLSELPHIKLNLYGQGGEVLVVIAAQGRTAPATELAENAAAQMEAAMGDSVYARGKKSLAAHVADIMKSKELNMIAPDAQTGIILEKELKDVSSADKIFDFGADSYNHAKLADKIADAAIMDDEESDDPTQLSADRSFAAKKITKSDFGVAISTVNGADTVGVSVTYGKLVYIRQVKAGPDAEKSAALTVFDMIRRLINGIEVPYARAFKAGHEIDWNEPSNQPTGKAVSQKGSKGLIIPIIVLVIVSVALGVGIWYIVQNFIMPTDGAMPVNASSAAAQQDGNTPQTADEQPQSTPQEQVADTGDQQVDTSQTAGTSATTSEAQATGENSTSEVHPFA